MAQDSFKLILLELLRQAQNDQNAFFQKLSSTELTAVGTPEYWSAKDHVAHMTFWRQRLVDRLQAIIRQEAQPTSVDFEQLNPIIFEEQRYRPWADILSESDQVYDKLITLSEQLTEEDLTAFNRFDWLQDGAPLYTTFMGNCYEHTQQHLAQYLLDHHDPEGAIAIYEVWVNRVIETKVPDTLKGYMIYNLACFYATHNLLEKAAPALQQAFILYPDTREFARTDPDLTSLRSDQPE